MTDQQYKVLRQKQTEVPGSGEYDQHFKAGQYRCAGCGNKLFASQTKFEANCGWPSFYDAIPGAVEMAVDDSLGMTRTEVICSQCQGHLGHVFAGEGFATPTDARYCINSASLDFDR